MAGEKLKVYSHGFNHSNSLLGNFTMEEKLFNPFFIFSGNLALFQNSLKPFIMLCEAL